MKEDKKGLVDKVKELVFASKEVEVVEVKFAEVKVADGTILNIEGEVAEGSIVSIISEDGQEVSKEADYTLEDGRTIKVDAEGKITEIVEAPAEEAKEDAKEVVIDPEVLLAEEGDAKEDEAKGDPKKDEEKEDEVHPLEVRVADLEKLIAELMSQFSEVNTKVEQFSALPAEEELKIKKEEFSGVKKTRATGLSALAAYRSK